MIYIGALTRDSQVQCLRQGIRISVFGNQFHDPGAEVKYAPVRASQIDSTLLDIGYRISIRCAPMRTPFHPDHATNRELRSIMRSYRSMRVRNRAFGRFPRQSVRHVQTSYHIDVRNSKKSKVAPPHVTLVAVWLEPDTNVFSMD